MFCSDEETKAMPAEASTAMKISHKKDRHLKEKTLQKTVTQFVDDGSLIDNASWILLRPTEQDNLSLWHKK